MNFSYQVKPTKQLTETDKGFLFNPSQLEVFVENKETLTDTEGNTTEVVNLHTILTEFMEDGTGTVKQDRMIKLPLALVANLFNGFDPFTMTPKIAIPALEVILRGYLLELS